MMITSLRGVAGVPVPAGPSRSPSQSDGDRTESDGDRHGEIEERLKRHRSPSSSPPSHHRSHGATGASDLALEDSVSPAGRNSIPEPEGEYEDDAQADGPATDLHPQQYLVQEATRGEHAHGSPLQFQMECSPLPAESLSGGRHSSPRQDEGGQLPVTDDASAQGMQI
jgi:hypothetical protein